MSNYFVPSCGNFGQDEMLQCLKGFNWIRLIWVSMLLILFMSLMKPTHKEPLVSTSPPSLSIFVDVVPVLRAPPFEVWSFVILMVKLCLVRTKRCRYY
jgi:hypothetical protein